MEDQQHPLKEVELQEVSFKNEECMICRQSHPSTGGIHIASGFICLSCESELIQTEVQDSRYDFYISQMKQFFFKKEA